MKILIKIKHKGKLIKCPGNSIMTRAVAIIDNLVIETDNDDADCFVEPKDSYKQKLHDLGIKPGKRFFIIKNEALAGTQNLLTSTGCRNNWDAIWSREMLKEHQKGKPECDQCKHSFSHKHSKKWSYKSCRDCEHGLNIVNSFIIDKNYYAEFKTKPIQKNYEKNKTKTGT